MSGLSDEGRKVVDEIAARHGFSAEAVTVMLAALAQGGGAQAQFGHPEFGGMGQWSQGGMTMIGDMFNNGLKARVEGLCSDLSVALQGAEIFRPAAASRQSQSQSSGGGMGYGHGSGSSLFVPDASRPGWPAALGQPASEGSQNDMRYAFFPAARRLAIAIGGRVTVYDTGDHQIGGFGQAQGAGQSISFTSQHGLVRVADLAVVEVGDGAAAKSSKAEVVAPKAEAPIETPVAGAVPAAPVPVAAAGPGAPSDDEQIFARIEKLADFHARGILSDEEYSAKKAELLARL